jgi:hypothetical protein
MESISSKTDVILWLSLTGKPCIKRKINHRKSAEWKKPEAVALIFYSTQMTQIEKMNTDYLHSNGCFANR